MQYTRAQPQYGYVLSGIRQNDLSNLAEHHYLVTFIAWQLASGVKQKGAQIDVGKVMEFCLIHDVGELFGGDIAMPYAKANPKAREYAKAFEAENHKFIARYFGDQQERFAELAAEILDAKSDEAIIAKLADYIEVTHYKKYMAVLDESDLTLIQEKIFSMLDRLTDEVAKAALKDFVGAWIEQVPQLKPFNKMLT